MLGARCARVPTSVDGTGLDGQGQGQGQGQAGRSGGRQWEPTWLLREEYRALVRTCRSAEQLCELCEKLQRD